VGEDDGDSESGASASSSGGSVNDSPSTTRSFRRSSGGGGGGTGIGNGGGGGGGSGGRASAGSKANRWSSVGLCLLYILVFLLAAAGCGAYYKLLKSSVAADVRILKLTEGILSLESELAALREFTSTHFDVVNSEVEGLEANVTSIYLDLDGRTSQQAVTMSVIENTVKRLSNRTTNADVLDALQTTKEHVSLELDKTKQDVNSQLVRTTRNVTERLTLTEIHMQKAQENVRDQLDQTVQTMKSVLATSTGQIHAMQSNVTLQLASMSHVLEETVSELNTAVDMAQQTIHEEVKVVQDSIEQYVAVTNKQFAAEDDFVKYQLAGTFTLLGCLISMWHLTSHARHLHKPDVQRKIMAVLWMVPIYSITSWLALVVPRFEQYFAGIRDCYEAYAVYTFIALLIAILEDGNGLMQLITNLARQVVEERHAVTIAKEKNEKRPAEHLRPPFPCCYEWHKPTQVAKAWLFQCKLMAMQFVIAKPLLTLVPFFVWLAGFEYDNHPPMNKRHQIDPTSPKVESINMRGTRTHK